MKEKGWEIKVRDVMVEDVAYVTVPGTREELMAICKSRYISGVPVVKDGKLVGIVTRQDVLKNPNEEQIALLMTRNPFTIGPDASVAEASRLMLTKKIRRLPVVEGDRLVGIISVADIVRVIADMDITEPIGEPERRPRAYARIHSGDLVPEGDVASMDESLSGHISSNLGDRWDEIGPRLWSHRSRAHADVPEGLGGRHNIISDRGIRLQEDLEEICDSVALNV